MKIEEDAMNSTDRHIRRVAVCALALLLTFLLGAAAGASPPGARPGPTADRYARLDEFVRDRAKETGVPGVGYAVVGPDGPVHRRTWGVDGRGDRVTAGTPFLWGSVAKPVTATSVMTLVRQGLLGLDDRVVDHVPRFRLGGPEHASRVTVRHLLGHTAGIPRSADAGMTDCLDAGCPRPAARLGALDGVRPLAAPGAGYAYTSADYLVLAAVVEAVTRQPFPEYLRRSVLDPAGMDGSVVDQVSAREQGLTPGHQRMWGVPVATAGGVDEHGASYGYLGGGLDDLSAFAALQLRAAGGGDEVLDRESARAMRTEGRLTSAGSPAAGKSPSRKGTGYGLGWRVGGLAAPLEDAVWHTGGSPGHSAMLFLLPGQDVALVLHQNLYGLLEDEELMHIGFGAARILAGADPLPAGQLWVSPYESVIWGTTALAVLLTLAVARSVLLLRRTPAPRSRTRRTVGAVLWCLAGALPPIAAALVAGEVGLRQLWTWLPDLCLALGWASAAGPLTVVLRIVLALRPRNAGEGECVGGDDRGWIRSGPRPPARARTQ